MRTRITSPSSFHFPSSSSPTLFCCLIVFLFISIFAFDLCHAFDTSRRVLDPRAACGPANKTSCCFQNLKGCPGCSNSVVESCVCKADSRCCSDTWDSLCVERAVTTCSYNCTAQCTNPCNEVSTCPGCIDKKQRECVCAKGRLPECCTMAWSARCVTMLIDACNGSATSPSPSPSYVPPSSTPSMSASPSVSPSYVPPSATPSRSVTPSVSVSATPSPSIAGSVTPLVSAYSTPSVSASATPSASPAPGAPSSMAWGVTIFLLMVGCLSITTCGAVALYYHRKKKRVEELGMPAAAGNLAYEHLENDEEGLFDGAEDDEEELPDPFSEEFVEREIEMRKLALPPSPRPPGTAAATTATTSDSEHLGNGNGNGHYVIDDTDDEDDHHHQQQHEEVSELVVRDDPVVEEIEEGVDPYAEL